MRSLFIILFVLTTFTSKADKFIVKFFSYNSNSQIAERYPRFDQNKQACALILIETNMRDIVFQADFPIIGEIKLKQGKYYVYLPVSSTSLKFQKRGLDDLKYQIPTELHPSGVYNLVLESVKTESPISDDKASPQVNIKPNSKKDNQTIEKPVNAQNDKAPKMQTSEKEEIDDDQVYIVVEAMPEFPGGEAAMIKFITKNIEYPRMAKKTGISGRVFLTFVVERDGSISDVQVLRGIGGGCDKEAIRVINMMPYWNPGKQHGKPVRVQYQMPITFTLQ